MRTHPFHRSNAGVVPNLTPNPLGTAVARSLKATLSLGLVATSFAGCAWADDTTTELEKVEVTGSRLKRPEIEGVLPVTVITREEIDRSGAETVSELLRNTTFNSFGSPRPTPLTNDQSFAGVSMHGLGTQRTLVLVDGHRLPTAPTVGSSQNLNNVPLSMVERIEILSDGASAIYGADAIGGVINIITRRGFSGADISINGSSPSRPGGDRSSASASFGINGEKGKLFLGASRFQRERVWARDRPWELRGASAFSNSLYSAIPEPSSLSGFRPGTRLTNPIYGSSVPGNGCAADGFYTTGTGASRNCLYDFTRVTSIESDLDSTSVYGNGTLNLNDDWSLNFASFASRTHIESTNAATPSSPWLGGEILIPVGSPNHPAVRVPTAGYDPTTPVFLRHRFVGIGNRERDTTDQTLNARVSADGRAGDFDLRFGVGGSNSRVRMDGHNYVLRDIADTYIRDGRYDIYNPAGNSASVLDAMRTSIRRDSRTRSYDLFGDARVDLRDLKNGTIQLAFGLDYRHEAYEDIYDPIVAANRVAGLSDSSASGSRTSQALYAEMLLPLWRHAELTVAGRYDHYSQFGGAFSPKVALRFQPNRNITLRASYGEGFAAPTLRNLNKKPSAYLSYVNHPATCAALGLGTACSAEIETYSTGNADLKPETSKQFSLGLSWQPWHWLDLTMDAFRISVDNQEAFVDTGLIANCLNTIGRRELCPRGLSVLSATAPRPQPGSGLGIAYGPHGEILYAQTGFANLGHVTVIGFDLGVNARFDLGNYGTLGHHIQFGSIGSYDSNGIDSAGGTGKPDGRLKLSTVWERKTLQATWNVNVVGGMDSLAGERANAGQSDLGYSHRLPMQVTHDLQLDWKTPWSGRMTLGIQNVTNQDPVVDPLGVSYNSALYEGYGRVPYFRYTQSF